jgi:AcrR family transcriptional regulator
MLKSFMQNIEKKISSKDKLIDAAITCLSDEGFNGFTATKLTKSANLGYGTFYKYFSSTEDILEAAIIKSITIRALKIEKINQLEKNKVIAFMRAVYFMFTELCHDPSAQWLQERPHYFCEICYDLTVKYAKIDADQVVASGLLSKSYTENFEIKFKLIIWQICGAIEAVKRGYDYKVIGYELMLMVAPKELDLSEAKRINKLVIDEIEAKK